MPYATIDDVTSEFHGLDFDSELKKKIEDYLKEAGRVVSQYDLLLFGRVDVEETDKLIDYHTHFLNRDVRTGAYLWEASPDRERVISDGVLQEADITDVRRHTLTFDTIYGSVSFSTGDHYLVEDVSRREEAEKYKACALLYAKMRSQESLIDGLEGVDVGDIELDFGDIESSADVISANNNPFEQRFRQIVGAGY